MSRLINLAGCKIGNIKVVQRSGVDSTGKVMWDCLCFCGAAFVATGLNLKSGNTKSCGCLKRRHAHNHLNIDGRRYNRLVVLARVPDAIGRKTLVKCVCDCGNEVIITYAHLSSGHTKSCGCYASERRSFFGKILARENGTGEGHPHWKGGISKLRACYRGPAFARWSREVRRMYDNSCFVCGCREDIQAHHINGWSEHPDKHFVLTNGVALCKRHHKDYHSKKGLLNVNSDSFKSWYTQVTCND